jgi:hypothetical protein
LGVAFLLVLLCIIRKTRLLPLRKSENKFRSAKREEAHLFRAKSFIAVSNIPVARLPFRLLTAFGGYNSVIPPGLNA